MTVHISDPAIAAAQRAWGEEQPPEYFTDKGPVVAEATAISAREALRPVQETWELLEAAAVHEDAEVARGMRNVLTAFAPIIFGDAGRKPWPGWCQSCQNRLVHPTDTSCQACGADDFED